MSTSQNLLPCDGCGLPAGPEHMAARLTRLELATRFRPVHIGVLFVALAPPPRVEDDFYGPPESRTFFDSFLSALDIPAQPEAARLAEFQHRGYYLAYLSECPLPPGQESAAETIARLGPNLIRRIRFNYRPKTIAPLGGELAPLIENLRAAGIGPIATAEKGQPLPIPGTGPADGAELFQRAVASLAPR